MKRSEAESILYAWEYRCDPTNTHDWNVPRLLETRQGRRVLQAWEDHQNSFEKMTEAINNLIDVSEDDGE